MTNGDSKTQNLAIKESKHLVEITTKKAALFNNVKITLIGRCNEHTNNKKKDTKHWNL